MASRPLHSPMNRGGGGPNRSVSGSSDPGSFPPPNQPRGGRPQPPSNQLVHVRNGNYAIDELISNQGTTISCVLSQFVCV